MDLNENLCGCGERDCPDCAPAEIQRQDARIAALEAEANRLDDEANRLAEELAAVRGENKRLRWWAMQLIDATVASVAEQRAAAMRLEDRVQAVRAAAGAVAERKE